MIKKRQWVSYSSVLSLLFFMSIGLQAETDAEKQALEKEKSLYIALAGPFSGSSREKGLPMIRGAQLKIDEVNAAGGIHGKSIKLIEFDDESDAKKAVVIANQVADSDALVVLGHRGSNASVSASAVYKKRNMPAIAASALSEKITHGNDWYFSVIPNNPSQAQTLSYYASQVLNAKTAVLIVGNNDFGKSIAKGIEAYASDAGLDIKKKILLDKKPKNLDRFFSSKHGRRIDKINPDLLIWAVKDKTAVPLLTSYRHSEVEIPILGTGSMGKKSFADRFNDLPEERNIPGYFTEGVYATAYVIYDIGSPALQEFRERYRTAYREDPDGSAASYYDAAGIAMDALSHIPLEQLDSPLYRTAIRAQLASYKSRSTSYSGVMGTLYFNEEGSSKKPILVSQFKQGKLLSANIQLNPVDSLTRVRRLRDELDGLPDAENTGQIIDAGDELFEKTNIAYIGSNITFIQEIDTLNKTTTMEFDIWVNSQNDLDLSNVFFSNSTTPLSLGQPVKEEYIDGVHHELFKIKGTFYNGFSKIDEKYGEVVIGFKLVDYGHTANELILVGDELNMPSTAGKALIDDANQRHILGHSSPWKLQNFLTFSGQTTESALGSPIYSRDAKKNLVRPDFSNVIVVVSATPSLRGLIPQAYALITVIICLVILYIPLLFKWAHIHFTNFILCILFLRVDQIKRKSVRVVKYFLVLFTTLTLLVASEAVFVYSFSNQLDSYDVNRFILLIDILWWVIPGFFVNLAVELFVWRTIEEKSERPVTNILRNFVRFIIYLLVGFGVVGYVFEQDLIALVTTLGVFGMIIGFAVKSNLSNVFSGIAINIERPVRVGDWIKVDPHPEGRVVDINWRATRLRLRDDSILCLPNTYAANRAICNYSYADNLKQVIIISMDAHHKPSKVEKILLSAVMASEGVLLEPSPSSSLIEINKNIADYNVVFQMENYKLKNETLRHVWNNIWESLDKENITPFISSKNAESEEFLADLD